MKRTYLKYTSQNKDLFEVCKKCNDISDNLSDGVCGVCLKCEVDPEYKLYHEAQTALISKNRCEVDDLYKAIKEIENDALKMSQCIEDIMDKCDNIPNEMESRDEYYNLLQLRNEKGEEMMKCLEKKFNLQQTTFKLSCELMKIGRELEAQGDEYIAQLTK